jgi:hypothetical protein
MVSQIFTVTPNMVESLVEREEREEREKRIGILVPHKAECVVEMNSGGNHWEDRNQDWEEKWEKE